MSKLRKVAAAGAVTTGFLVLSVPAAMASDTGVTLPYRGYGAQAASHTFVSACDTRADGWGVRTEYLVRSGYRGHVGDGNGSASGCGGRFVTTTNNPVIWIRVCADYCTSWITA